MKIRIVSLAIILTVTFYQPVLAQTTHGHKQDKDLKPEQIKPRIGIMSEAVARQKLVTYGVTDLTELKLVGYQYVIRAKHNGRPVELEMHAQTGLLREKGATTPLPVAASRKNRVIRGRQIKVERRELVKPERLQ